MLLLPIVFGLVAPAAFAETVEKTIAPENMHVVAWWADDLDGDHVTESIALACNADSGMYVVQHGAQLTTTPVTIDGRNPCPEAEANPPRWRIEKIGTIAIDIGVHHGHIRYALALRANHLVLVAEDDDGIEVSRAGTSKDAHHADYDALTWSKRSESPVGAVTKTGGPIVVVTDKVRRTSKLIGASTIAATRDRERYVLHVHADRELVVKRCLEATPCAVTRLAKGDSELGIAATDEVEIVADRTTIGVHFQPLDGDQSFPSPPAK